ncbi:unnamed protein product, partial [Owenia fusiformis]
IIILSFNSFDIEYDMDCNYDFLQINDGPSESSPLIGRFCGTQSPIDGRRFSSTDNQLYFLFSSDVSVVKEGIEMSWTASACGGRLNGLSGSFRYPLESDTNYTNDASCAWVITVPIDEIMMLSFTRFDIEDGGPNCTLSDFLQINDGPSASSPLIGRFCESHPPVNITSTNNQLYLWFSSDSTNVRGGFEVTYSVRDVSGCGTSRVGDSGSYRFPAFGTTYQNDLKCEWTITVPAGKTIVLSFGSFNIEGMEPYCFDSLQINDGPSES